MAGLSLRPAQAGDAESMAALYAPFVLNTAISFELDPPSPQLMRARWQELTDAGHPWWLALRDGAVLGFAYAAPFRSRPAYRHTLEHSVYVAPIASGQGVGRALMDQIFESCRARSVRQLIAVIGDPDQHPSADFHRALGFERCGLLRAVGYKFGREIDVLLMQLSLTR